MDQVRTRHVNGMECWKVLIWNHSPHWLIIQTLNWGGGDDRSCKCRRHKAFLKWVRGHAPPEKFWKLNSSSCWKCIIIINPSILLFSFSFLFLSLRTAPHHPALATRLLQKGSSQKSLKLRKNVYMLVTHSFSTRAAGLFSILTQFWWLVPSASGFLVLIANP